MEKYETTAHRTNETYSPCKLADGYGANDARNSSVTSSSTSTGDLSGCFVSTNKQSSGRDSNEDEYPNKKLNPEKILLLPGTPELPTFPGQMSCPMLELHGCQGTNTTISELMRSLMNRHRVVICKECCAQLLVEDERKPASVLQKHISDGCERRCIGRTCTIGSDDNASPHRRKESCSSWGAISKEERWTFIWKLVNPGLTPPEPNFLSGPGFEHSQTKKLCKQQTRARTKKEICENIMRISEAKDRRISTLENDLTTAKNENVQTQRRCNEKIGNLENIIESLVERLCENDIGLPGSLRKRVQNECPEVMATILAKESQTVPTLSTSTLTPNHGYYPGSDVSSTWGNTTCPPSTIPTIPVTWGAVPQLMVAPNPGYYCPEFSEKAPTTSAMYPTSAYLPNWDSINMSLSTMQAQVGRYSSSETPETVQPGE